MEECRSINSYRRDLLGQRVSEKGRLLEYHELTDFGAVRFAMNRVCFFGNSRMYFCAIFKFSSNSSSTESCF